MSDEYDSDIWGVWDPLGNPHDRSECLCPNCGPTEEALAYQQRLEREADQRERVAKSQAMSRAVREHREKFDAERLAEEDKWLSISYAMYLRLPVTPEEKRWHDRVLEERRERYQRTKGES